MRPGGYGYQAGQSRYEVTGPAVVAALAGGGEIYVYQGGLLPTGTRPSQIDHLVKAGLVKEIVTEETS